MGMTFAISALLGLGWILAIGIGIALLALTHYIGSQYAFTQSGISRMGPRLGEQLLSTSFFYHEKKSNLHEVLSFTCPTLLVFLSGSAHAEPGLISGLLEFATVTENEIRLVIFSSGSAETFKSLIERRDLLNVSILTEDNLAVRLGIRVMPYALLVDRHGRLRSKGMIKYLYYLCRLIVSAQPQFSEDDLVTTVNYCRCLGLQESHQ